MSKKKESPWGLTWTSGDAYTMSGSTTASSFNLVDDKTLTEQMRQARWKRRRQEIDRLDEAALTKMGVCMHHGKYIKNWFSNMLPFDEPLSYQNIEFFTVENLYQALKLPKEDVKGRHLIARMNPYQARRYAREEITGKGRLRKDWDDKMKRKVMMMGLRHKFQPGTSWHAKLMATGDEEIVEWNNWHDLYWGKDADTGAGENHLGRLLMALRAEYRSQA